MVCEIVVLFVEIIKIGDNTTDIISYRLFRSNNLSIIVICQWRKIKSNEFCVFAVWRFIKLNKIPAITEC